MGSVFKALIAFFLFGTLTMCVGAMSSGTKNTAPPATAIDYELDLTERCKDWIFNRNKAYKLSREGDVKGAEQAQRAMRKFDTDLRGHFSDEQIRAEIERLERSGYKVGF